MQKRLQDVQARAGNDESASAEASALQAQVASVSGALLEATAQLAEALQDSGAGSSGALIDTTA